MRTPRLEIELQSRAIPQVEKVVRNSEYGDAHSQSYGGSKHVNAIMYFIELEVKQGTHHLPTMEDTRNQTKFCGYL